MLAISVPVPGAPVIGLIDVVRLQIDHARGRGQRFVGALEERQTDGAAEQRVLAVDDLGHGERDVRVRDETGTELLPGADVAVSVMLPMPTEWWLRPVRKTERVGEQRAVVCHCE